MFGHIFLPTSYTISVSDCVMCMSLQEYLCSSYRVCSFFLLYILLDILSFCFRLYRLICSFRCHFHSFFLSFLVFFFFLFRRLAVNLCIFVRLCLCLPQCLSVSSSLSVSVCLSLLLLCLYHSPSGYHWCIALYHIESCHIALRFIT